MTKLAIIGGTGAALFPGQSEAEATSLQLKWGEPSAGVRSWRRGAHEILFLPRHGEAGNIPPHRVNYRANVSILKELGAEQIIALNAVGGISVGATPGRLVIPDQLIDYSWGRDHTYYDGNASELEFIDFTKPYNDNLRQLLISAGVDIGANLLTEGTYGVTQGPRLETAAEISRLEQDGCNIVGMTSMPEAALARELDMPYASCSIVVNWAAGRSSTAIHAEIEQHLRSGMLLSAQLIEAMLNHI